ncbi:MAG: hypothetical protein ACE144_14915 [Thermodesulfobacteriota bacterium]
MKKAYEIGHWCFDLPSSKDLESFRELKELTDDETLVGICHLDAERGVSFLGKPFHQFESKALSTIKKNLFLPHTVQYRPPVPSSSEVFTQKEIDRISFDSLRFEKGLSPFRPEETPFLLIGERYGDWLLALGRIDLLKEMVLRVREKGLIPIFSGQWATFVLPKAKPLDVAAYAIPINKKWGHFDLTQACDLIKKFDRPVISLNPLDDGRLLEKSEEAFSFLFDELKISSAIAGIRTEEEARTILEALKKFPSLIPRRKT